MALVITIVIIIILATITINMVFGDNGLVEKAKQAKNMTEGAVQKEQSGLANATAWLNEIIYGEGSSGDIGANEETPGTNSAETNGTDTNTDANSTETNLVDTNSVDTNSVDTNTVEPPPVEEIPDGEEEGAIIFGTATWNDGKAEIIISTETEYKIEYQINKKDEGSWTELSLSNGAGETKQGTVTGLNNNDTIYARLTDGTNHGKETSTTIKDSIAPQVTVTKGEITTNSIAVSVNAVDNESGMSTAINYIYYIKKSSEPDTAYVQEESNNTNTYTFTGLAQGTSYDIKVEAIGDKAGNKGIGILVNQTTATLPGGEGSITGGEITFGKPNWKDGTASITVSTDTEYKIEYQVNGTDEGGWKEIGSGEEITGLKYGDTVNVRLTDGNNYGEPASTVVTDEVAPGKANIAFDSNEIVIGDNVVATVTHTDNESGVEITKSKWILNTTATNIGTEEGSYASSTSGMSGTFTKNNEEITIPTKDMTAGTYYLHVLTVDKAGNKVETISEAVVLKKIEGSIEFGTPTWKSGTASVSLNTTETSYSIQYKINEESWANLADAPTVGEEEGGTGEANTGAKGTIAGLNNNDVLYARLTNGTQYGKEVSTTIKDETAPQVTVQVQPTTNSITVNAEAKDNETGLANSLTYIYYIKQTSEEESSYTQGDTHTVDNASNNNTVTDSYTFEGLTQGTSYDIKVEVVGDKAGNKGSSTVTGQITESLPGGDEGLEQGAISFGSITWSGGTASVPVSTNTSFTIEYQVATGEPTEGNWKTIANNGSATGINHNETIYARLTDGVNYGEHASMTIKDTKVPTLEITQDEVTDKSIKVTANAVDNETGLATESTYKFYLNNELKATQTEATYTFEELTPETQYSIKVEAFDKAGNMATQTVDITTLEEQGMDSSEIASKPIEYYGAEVINYDMDVPSAGVDKWRIFYADDTNIYLIADDYIEGKYAPDGQGGSEIYLVTYVKECYLTFDEVYKDYTGASWSSKNSKGAKWLSQYLEANGSNIDASIAAVAYMMDTNVWSAYYASEDAEYAMGGPTIEMFCASYKDTHPSKYIECGNLNSNGYHVRWNGDSWGNISSGLVSDEFDGIFRKSDEDKSDATWLASPSAYSSGGYLLRIDCDSGTVNYEYCMANGSMYSDYAGFRPIVCLKSDTKLEKLDDGTFQIIKSPELPVTAKDISKAPRSYYGREVTNYTAPHVGVDKWRIFYADDTNVYLIADDYIAAGNVPKGQGGSSIYKKSTYELSFNNVIYDYSGASWISENSKGSKWISQYLSQNASSTYTNIRAVAYMMDTNVWSAYYASEDAEYAMGGPTLEVFCASYKDTHPSKYLECGNLNSYGYKVRWNGGSWTSYQDGLVQDDFNSIYIKSSTSKAKAMWLVSPSAYDDDDLMYAYYDGIVKYYDYDYYTYDDISYGLRPLVCLKSGVQIKKQDNGTCTIVK